ncbi:hypothetical protein DSUL_90066 [Desulfovibrionales bacterium]
MFTAVINIYVTTEREKMLDSSLKINQSRTQAGLKYLGGGDRMFHPLKVKIGDISDI